MAKDQSKSSSESYDLKLMKQCPLCQGSYQAGEDNVVTKKTGAHLVHITCPHCQGSVLAVITISQMGLGSIGMITDLNAEDVKRLHGQTPISEDELLEFHGLLKNKENLKLLTN